ncbi:hypothetical protein L2X99_01565 [Microbacterium sp. KUDC0406]|uniref:hypothetical protein n=1 Tax=Microbacterium sp. KUDC0406 TaxID=2909588 RepID=UPI001F172C78|nr:hypothetical protein [Microbacterium sp. KUDC0406]UJP10418.1 hypothetical protein L2X99_01565 [Microbacterium sp. KUDC0406]
MTEPALAPRNAYLGVYVVWGIAVVASIVLGIVLDEDARVPWMLVAFGIVVLLSFAVQLWFGRVEGFIVRVSASVIGALLIMGLISVGFGLAALVPVA